jgi:hypothetical protein
MRSAERLETNVFGALTNFVRLIRRAIGATPLDRDGDLRAAQGDVQSELGPPARASRRPFSTRESHAQNSDRFNNKARNEEVIRRRRVRRPHKSLIYRP